MSKLKCSTQTLEQILDIFLDHIPGYYALQDISITDLEGLEHPLSDRICRRFMFYTRGIRMFNIHFSPGILSDAVRESFFALTEAVQMSFLISPNICKLPQNLILWRNCGLSKDNASAKQLLRMIATRPLVKTLNHFDFLENVSLCGDEQLFNQVLFWLKQQHRLNYVLFKQGTFCTYQVKTLLDSLSFIDVGMPGADLENVNSCCEQCDIVLEQVSPAYVKDFQI